MSDETNTTTEPIPAVALIREQSKFNRRGFLRKAGLAGAAIPVAGGLVASACYNDPTGNRITATPTPPAGVKPGPTPVTPERWETIDHDHQEGVLNFLRNQKQALTAGKGNQPLEPRIENGVKVFDLTVDELDWEVAPGQFEKGRGFNEAIPGPILRGRVGDRVRINVKNNLEESTSVHWHGIYVPNNMDGVPYLTQDPIQPGATFSYEFTLRNSGSHMYHSHHDSADQVNRGLLGAFIIDPEDPSTYPQYDREYVLIMNDTLLGYTLNGKGFPATDALIARKGERVLIRWMNEGMMYHPMHLHGLAMEAFERDGYPHEPYKCDNIDVPPGSRVDCIIECFEAGLWAFHCHVLSHAENAAGFFGLVTVLAVEDENFKVADLLDQVQMPADNQYGNLRVEAAAGVSASSFPQERKGAFTLWCETQA